MVEHVPASISALSLALAITLSACSGTTNKPGPSDQMEMSFDLSSGQPIPKALPNPEQWIFLGVETVPGQRRTMAWVKPVGMSPRPLTSVSSDAIKQLGKLRQPYPGQWTDMFEYQNLAEVYLAPEKYLDVFKQQALRGCPSATVAALRVDSAEFLLELKSGGCAAIGDEDEILRLLFRKRELFNLAYTVKSRDMTQAQRDVAMKAVDSWNLSQ